MRKLPRQQARLRRQWFALQHRVPTNGEPLWPQLSQWVRDLVEDGDVEPNPGSSSSASSRRMPAKQLNMCNINVNGPPSMWAVLRNLPESDVILCQETAFPSVKAAQAFETSAYRHGFRFYCQPGPVGHRGVGILVRKALRCKRMKKWSHDDAQAIAVMVDGAILVSMYVSCSGHAPELQGGVLEFLTREYKHVPWFLFGDHNELPETNIFSQILVNEGASMLIVRDENGEPLPTRHDGSRCIDYGITNRPDDFDLKGFWPGELSDHKVLQGLISTGRTEFETTWKRTKVVTCGRPADVLEETWQTTLSQLWPPLSDSLYQPVLILKPKLMSYGITFVRPCMLSCVRHASRLVQMPVHNGPKVVSSKIGLICTAPKCRWGLPETLAHLFKNADFAI